jgi:hypothetical protein
MARILTWISLAATSAATFALTLVVLFSDRVPRWQGWAAVLAVVLVASLTAYLSGRRALLNEDLRRIDDEIRREDAEERRRGRDPLAG